MLCALLVMNVYVQPAYGAVNGGPGITDAGKEIVSAAASDQKNDDSVDSRIEEMISKMSVKQKLAQMMIVTYRTDTNNTVKLTKSYKKLLKKYDFGGIILFAKNIVDTKQTVTLIRDSQKAAMTSENGIPMLVCVDQEGGLVNRVSFGTVSSGSMALSAAGSTALTEESADILGQEIAALGFNMDFAPVSDVNNNPNNPIIGTRSFSDDPGIAAEHVKAFIKGLSKNNIAASLKHFPGHGNVGEDSHTGLPSSDLTVEELKTCELIPFEAGIEAGADMIMTAHIQFPNIENETYISKADGQAVYLPATLSHTIMTGLLREDMGYDGIIITDAMDMGAITTHFDETDAAVLAINAGVDILLCPVNVYKDSETSTFSHVNSYMSKLAARVKAGDIKEEELDDSVARILKLKFKNGIMDGTLSNTNRSQLKTANKVVGSAEHHNREWEIAQQGMTLLKNDDGMLPLNGKSGKNTLILIPAEARRPAVEYAVSRLEKEGLADASSVSIICYSGIDIDNSDLQKALKKADNVLIMSQSATKNQLVCQVIEKVHKTSGHKAALLSLGLPYDTACYEDTDAVICAYNPYGSAHDAEGNGPFNLNVAVVLCTAFGESVPCGTLPVNVPKIVTDNTGKTSFSDEILYKRGSGLKDWK